MSNMNFVDLPCMCRHHSYIQLHPGWFCLQTGTTKPHKILAQGTAQGTALHRTIQNTLYCTALHKALHYTALHCTAQYTSLYFTALHWTRHCTAQYTSAVRPRSQLCQARQCSQRTQIKTQLSLSSQEEPISSQDPNNGLEWPGSWRSS